MTNPFEDVSLAEFQTALLEVLDGDLPPEHIAETLAATVRDEALSAFIRAADPRTLSVARELLKKWGTRSAD